MQYHLVFTSDKDYISYLFVAVQSVIDHLDQSSSEPNESMVFHVIVDESVELAEIKPKAEAFVQRNHSDACAFSFEFHALEKELFADFTPWREKAHKEARSPYYRILLDQFLDESVHRALYLDIDIVVQADVRELFRTHSLEGKILAVAPDVKRQGLKDKDRTLPSKQDPNTKLHIDLAQYFNTGVMLVNLDEWRSMGVSQACVAMGQTYRVTLHAQDLLNYIVQGKFEWLDVAWNFMQTSAEKKLKKGETAVVPKIIQFSPHKPWRQNDYVYPIPDSLVSYAAHWSEAAQKVVEFEDTLPKVVENVADVPLFSFKTDSWKQKLLWVVAGVALFGVNIGMICMLLLK